MKARQSVIACLVALLSACATEDQSPIPVPPPAQTPSSPQRAAAKAPASQPPSPALIEQKYQRVVSTARTVMGGSRISPQAAQRVLELDSKAQAAVSEVMKDEGRRAGPVAIKAALDALAELSSYLAGLPQ